MSWWVYTDTGKTGTCERCKRPLAEHSHTCFACHTNRRPNAVLAPGNVTSFSLHSYKDHPPGMKHSSISICGGRRVRALRDDRGNERKGVRAPPGERRGEDEEE